MNSITKTLVNTSMLTLLVAAAPCSATVSAEKATLTGASFGLMLSLIHVADYLAYSKLKHNALALKDLSVPRTPDEHGYLPYAKEDFKLGQGAFIMPVIIETILGGIAGHALYTWFSSGMENFYAIIAAHASIMALQYCTIGGIKYSYFLNESATRVHYYNEMNAKLIQLHEEAQTLKEEQEQDRCILEEIDRTKYQELSTSH